jgi:hypothetical protein
MCAEGVAGRPELVDRTDHRTLVRMLRVMLPHRDFSDGPYERTVDALLADAASTPYLGAMLSQGVRDLDSLGARPFAELDEEDAYGLLERIQRTPFFIAVRTKAINTLYSDHEAWEALGYEGPSFEKGGYLYRGFDDLGWLADPPL